MPTPSCDILIFTAVQSEREALEAAAFECALAYEVISADGLEYRHRRGVGTNRVMAVETKMGPFGFDGSAARAIQAKSATRAQSLVGLGMAFGVDHRTQNVGDVLVSTSILTYDDRKIIRDGKGNMLTQYDKRILYPAREQILRPLRQEAGRCEEIRTQFGSMLSGGCAVQCAVYRDELVTRLSAELRRYSPTPDERIIGGEMEACGLIAASEREAPSWVVVKGISDFADEQRDTMIAQGRLDACRSAARFLLNALRNFDPDAG